MGTSTLFCLIISNDCCDYVILQAEAGADLQHAPNQNRQISGANAGEPQRELCPHPSNDQSGSVPGP